FESIRAVSYSLIGIDAYLARFGGASEVRRARSHLAEKVFARFAEATDADWPWPEPVVTYANASMPEALIVSGAALDRPDMIATGLRTLRWLLKVQTDPKGHFVPIGNHGWYARGEAPARFDQQPIEVQHTVDALVAAYEATGDRTWLEEARRCFE